MERCCDVPFSLQGFFADATWRHVPPERQGQILIEPLYPRGGLCGGSPGAGEAKISKLAALAAARKKKENEKHTCAESHESNASVAMLEKLDTRTPSAEASDLKGPANSGPDTQSVASQSRPTRHGLRYPSKRRDYSPAGSFGKGTPKEAPPHASESENPAKEATPRSNPTAAPSVFAKTMFGDAQDPILSVMPPIQSLALSFPRSSGAKAKSDPFAGPSPDDVVAKAQSSSKGSARKGEAKQRATDIAQE